LSPRSVVRANVAIGSGGQGIFGRLSYDPARRRVVFTPDDPAMFPGTAYQLIVRAGLLAWDGTPMGEEQRRDFVTSDAGYVAPASVVIPTLQRDIAPFFASRCALSNCHGGGDPVMGLDLSSADAIRRTAIAVIARERPASSVGASFRTDPTWGAMLRIDVGNGREGTTRGEPAYSYLVYKILGDGPVEGDRMPPPDLAPLGDAEVRMVSDWIAAGAE
jgi:hypothetical protein